MQRKLFVRTALMVFTVSLCGLAGDTNAQFPELIPTRDRTRQVRRCPPGREALQAGVQGSESGFVPASEHESGGDGWHPRCHDGRRAH